MRKQFKQLRRIPLFPLIPIVPVLVVGGSFVLSILSFIRVRRLSAQLTPAAELPV